MKCQICNNNNENSSKYCGHCGKSLPGGVNRAERAVKEKEPWPKPGLTEELESIRLKRMTFANMCARILLYITLFGILFAYLFISPLSASGLAFAAFFIGISFYNNVNSVSGVEYLALPGALDDAGKHHCVHCGHSGVYKRGAYRSRSTWHECTGCRKTLFVD